MQLVQIRTIIEYRADFWIGAVGSALMSGAGLVFISALFTQVPDVAGWTAWEIGLLYGLAMTSRGLAQLFCEGPWSLRSLVNSGEFDRLLVRPIHGLGDLVVGVTVILVGAGRVGLDWSPFKVGFLVLSILSSFVLLSAIGFLVNMVGFWEPSTQGALPTMYSRLIDFARFPLDIYNLVIQILVTVVAPFAFVSYFPSLVLLEKDTPWRWLGFASPLVTALVVAITAWLWHKALARYQGVGH
jgi:ABC-2 type transport system permease protein